MDKTVNTRSFAGIGASRMPGLGENHTCCSVCGGHSRRKIEAENVESEAEGLIRTQ